MNTESKHTAAPWEVSQQKGLRLFIVAKDEAIAEVLIGEKFNAELFANAHLIAAAPAMLEALTEFLKHDGGPGSLDYDAHKRYEARKAMIDAVLAASRHKRGAGVPNR